MFLVGGAVQAEGTVDEKIVIQGTGADNFFEVVDYEGSLTLDYCVFDGAQHLWAIGDGVDQVILRHSEIMNVAEHSGLVHWRKPCYIEYNLFINSGGFGMYNWFGTDLSAKMYIRYNVVKANSDVFVSCSSSVYGLGFVIEYNSFVDVEGTLLSVFTGLGTWDITATENYWGTTDTEIIDSLINDKSDDISLPVEIEYSPFLTGPHPDGAILPITVGFEYSPDELYVDVEFEVDASASFAEYSAIANYTWDFGDGTIETLDESVTTYSFDAAGDYEIVLTVTDEYGFQNSTSTTVTVLDDTNPPVTTDDYDGDWQTSDFTITLTAVDEETGIAETYYKINNGTTKTVSDDGQPVIDDEGSNCTLEYWSEDNAGNIEEATLVSEIMLDKTDPEIGTPTATPEIDIQENQDVTITVEISDSLSGVDTVTLSYSTDDKTNWTDVSMTLNSTTELWQGTIPGQTIWTNINYKLSAYDVAGNLATSNASDIFSYDVIPEFAPTVILLVFSVLALGVFLLRKKIV
jgi:hypothetical protein